MTKEQPRQFNLIEHLIFACFLLICGFIIAINYFPGTDDSNATQKQHYKTTDEFEKHLTTEPIFCGEMIDLDKNNIASILDSNGTIHISNIYWLEEVTNCSEYEEHIKFINSVCEYKGELRGTICPLDRPMP